MAEKKEIPVAVDRLTDLLPPEYRKSRQERMAMLSMALPMVFMRLCMGIILWYPNEMIWIGIGENIYEAPLFFVPLFAQMFVQPIMKLVIYPKLGGKVEQMLTLYPTVDGIILEPYHMVVKMDESGKLAAEEVTADIKKILDKGETKHNVLTSAINI